MKKSFTPSSQRDPLDEMAAVLQAAGRIERKDQITPWLGCLCTLTLFLEPACKTFRFLEALPYNKNVNDDVDILNTMANLGYFSRSSYQQLLDIEQRLLPALFIDNQGSPWIILEKGEDKLKIYRNSNIESIETRKLENVTGTCWFFQRYDENKAKASRFMREGSGHSWFRAILGRFKSTLLQVVITGLFINLIALTTPLFIILVYGRVIAAGSTDTLPMLAIGMGMVIAVEYSFRRIRSYALSWLAGRMDNIVGNRIFSHLIGLPPSLIERASVAAQVARIKTFESVRDFFSGSVFLSMMEIPYVVLSLLAVYFIAGKLALVPLAMIAAYIALFSLMHSRIKVVIRLAAKTSSARQQYIIETFEKLTGIRRFGMARMWQNKFRTLSGQEMMAHFHLNYLGMVAETLAHALTVLSAVLTVGFGVNLLWSGQIGAGALVATMILVWRILTPFYSMCTMIPRLEQLRNSIIQVNNLMDLDTEAIKARAYASLPKMRGKISFNHVHFRYNDNADPVFQDLSFELKPGDLMMITGENGSGKTTVLKLIKSMYGVSEGSVLIDDFDIRQLETHDLRRQIAYIPQQADFFSGTIIENMRAANPLASKEEIKSALEKADALSEIEKFSLGIDTPFERCRNLGFSPMLMTKLSLARAYLHQSPIILIDELPNALLVSRTGKKFRDFLIANKGKRTCIFVTYRDDFIKLADTLLVLKNGESAVLGTPTEVLGKYMEAA
jgi:ATP-binding cassette subfamily C protein LapB